MNEPIKIISTENALPVAVEMSMLERMARDPNIDVEKIEKLMDMQERAEDRKAKADFNAAMARAQSNILPVIKNATNEQTRSRYATLSTINKTIMPIYSAEGLAVSFNTGKASVEGYTRHIATVFHSSGHSEEYHIDMPPEGTGIKGNAMMTATHATGSSSSYARRYLICMIFNVSTEDDNDGNGNKPKSDPMDTEKLLILLGRIQAASNINSLKTAFAVAHSAASESKDRDATDSIIKAYEAVKTKFTQADKIRVAVLDHAEKPGGPNMAPKAVSKPPNAPPEVETKPLSDLAKPVESPPYVAPPPAEPKADKLTKHEKDAAKIKAVLDNITDEVTRKEISALVYHYATKQQPKTKTIDYGRYVAAIEDLWRDAQGSDDDKILPVFITAMRDRFKK